MSRPAEVSGRVRWIVVIGFAIGFAVVMERLISIEWSFPYCNDPQDGPASAVFGAPLPYERWSVATSLAYDFLPRVYLVNIVICFAVSLPLVRYLAERMATRSPQVVYGTLGVTGFVLCGLVVVHHWFVLATGLWCPVASINFPPYDAYEELRPVGISLGRHYDCTPSSFWFPSQWQAPHFAVRENR